MEFPGKDLGLPLSRLSLRSPRPSAGRSGQRRLKDRRGRNIECQLGQNPRVHQEFRKSPRFCGMPPFPPPSFVEIELSPRLYRGVLSS